MYLKREEEKMLDGEYGEVLAKCMRLLVTVGELFEAKKLINVKSCHISGVSYKNIGDFGLKLLKEFTAENVRVKVKTTINPMGMDRSLWFKLNIDEDFAKKQFKILSLFNKIGARCECTCTPYLAGNKPKMGENIAWAETSAAIYANSVLAARTNRESGLSALASALTGKTPYYGYHLSENRKPTIHIKVKFKPLNQSELSILGYFIGKAFPNSVPIFSGLNVNNLDELKILGSGLASSGNIALYHVEEITPEAKIFSKKGLLKNLEKFEVSRFEIKRCLEELNSGEEDFNSIFLGCPHYSLTQLKNLSKSLNNKKIVKKFYVSTSKRVYAKAEKLGIISKILKCGGFVLRDTCMVVAPIEKFKIKGIITDSAKAAYYLKNMGFKVKVKSLEECVKFAVEN